MRKWIVRMAVGLLSLVLAVAVALLGGFLFWRSGIERQLRTGSTVMQTERGPVEYAEIGHGPAVLVIHGTPGGYDLWFNTLEATHAARDGLRYILPSRPGYLRTPLSDGATPAEQADVLAALLDRLHIAKAAVVGVSGGGPSALQFALRHPDRCTAIILEEAVIRSLNEPTSNLPRSTLAAANRDLEIYGMYLGAGLYGLEPKYAQSMRVARAQLLASAPYALRKAGVLNDLTQEAHIPNWPLNHIHCPTLILQGTADQNVPPADAEYAHTQIVGSQLREFPRADHLMVIFRSQELRSIVEGFIQAHPEGNPRRLPVG